MQHLTIFLSLHCLPLSVMFVANDIFFLCVDSSFCQIYCAITQYLANNVSTTKINNSYTKLFREI